MAYPKVNWITNGQDWSDYRPAIASDGKTILFERSAAMHTRMLYRLVIDSGKDPAPFLPHLAGAQSRPGWCWKNDVIAFNLSKDNATSVYTVGGDGKNPTEVPKSDGFLYPQWDASGESLTVMNKSKSAVPDRCTCVINKNGVMLQPNVNGSDSKGKPMFGGMPAVNPLHADRIAFAGQPNWEAHYNQDKNYIFLNHFDGTKYTSSPMEPQAPIGAFHASFQGRAPAWSPNGRYVVFESDRRRGGYALFLFDTRNPSDPAVQLTDPKANPAQHAKWYPDGWCVIFCANPPHHPNNFAIAYIVISDYVS
jgi:Tol biopolymer transport system component